MERCNIKYFKILLVVLLVFAFSDAQAQRAPIKMSGKTIEGTEAGSGSILQVNPANLVDGDIFIVEFQGDSSFGYQKFIYKFDTESEEVHNSPWVLDPTRDTDYGRWLLVDASEWPCDPAVSNCYVEFPDNTGHLTSTPDVGKLWLYATDETMYTKNSSGISSMIGGEGGSGLPIGGFAGATILKDGSLTNIWSYADDMAVAYGPSYYSVSTPNLGEHLAAVDELYNRYNVLLGKIEAIEAVLEGEFITFSSVSVEPTSWGYGMINTGLTSNKSFTYTAGGTESLVGGTASIAGTDTDQFSITADSCSSETITVGNTCAITVQYAPDEVAQHSAILRLPSNATGSPKDVALTGEGTSGGGGTAQLFYSDFEDSTDRDQWTANANFDLDCDYACSEYSGLFGSYSAKLTGTTSAREMRATYTDDESGVIYVRAALRVLSSSFNTVPAIQMHLTNSIGSYVGGYLFASVSTNVFYRLYAEDGASSGYAAMSHALNDGTYWLYLTYVKGSYIQMKIKNSSNEELYSYGRNTAKDFHPEYLVLRVTQINYLLDSVEIRTDQSWGE